MIIDRSGRKVDLFAHDGDFARFVVFIRDHEQDGGIMASTDILDEARQEARALLERLENEEGGAGTRYVVLKDLGGVLPEECFHPGSY